MASLARLIIGATLAIRWASPAHCQPQLGNIYHADNHTGMVFIYAENHAFVPYTVVLDAKLVKMQCPVALPARFVVFPSKLPHLITTFTYEPGQLYSFEYSQTNQFGIYTGHAPDSSFVYQLPFERNEGVERHPAHGKHQRRIHHHYFFNLPENTPVRAARESIVADFRQDLPTAKGGVSNYIMLFHDDGTYAEYTNFNQNSVAVQLGQRVAAGDIIYYASGLKRHWFRFCVLYPGRAHPEEVSVVFGSPN